MIWGRNSLIKELLNGKQMNPNIILLIIIGHVSPAPKLNCHILGFKRIKLTDVTSVLCYRLRL